MFWDISTTTTKILDLESGTIVSLAGRVTHFRKMGGVAFGRVCDQHGSIQFAFNKRQLDEETFSEWTRACHIGDIVGLVGHVGTSSTGETTVFVQGKFEVLQRSTKPFPDKFHGLTDPEQLRRKRFLDCAINPAVKNRFRLRSQFLSALRQFLTSNDFLEIETPTLCPQASGAQAKPFVTHHNALGVDFYLRIAPETYLKRAVAGGFDRVFEIGKNFRNEGTDPSHLQEFTSCEWYKAYDDYLNNLGFFRRFLEFLAALPAFSAQSQVLQAWSEAPQVSYGRLFANAGLNIEGLTGREIDNLFKAKIRPGLVEPVFVYDYPAALSPMAARRENAPDLCQQWQFLVNGWEVVKCYTELTDPVEQRKLLEDQAAERASGDDEAMMLEEDFLECMEYGMPPMSGVGIGVDRMMALLLGEENLRDVVLFPPMRALKE